ncbi:MAG: hypothetical protein JWO58_2962 [Chitinophagaceae bacterium]|nr:hypothetical protein [Chitinophagaceae bacterium]
MTSTEGESLSRWDLIDGLSNKEGGAHVDKNGPGNIFDKFRHKSSGNMSIIRNEQGDLNISNDSSNPKDFDNKPIWASARQIAYELLETIKKHQLL